MSWSVLCALWLLVVMSAGQGSPNCSTGTPVSRNGVTGPWTSPPQGVNGTNVFSSGCGTTVGRWYTYTGSSTYNGETVSVTTCSSLTTADTVIGVYTSCGATCLVANDDDRSCLEGFASTVTFTANYFLTYYIWVSFNGDGDYYLRFQSLASPTRSPSPSRTNYYYNYNNYDYYNYYNYNYDSTYNFYKTAATTTALAIALPVGFVVCFFVIVPLIIVCSVRNRRKQLLTQARNSAQAREREEPDSTVTTQVLPSSTPTQGAAKKGVIGTFFTNRGAGVDVYSRTSPGVTTGGDPSTDDDRAQWVTKYMSEQPEEGPSQKFPSATDQTPYVGYMEVNGTNHDVQLPLAFRENAVEIKGGRGTYSERTNRFAFTVTEDGTLTEFAGVAKPSSNGPPNVLSDLTGNWRRVSANGRVVSGAFVLIADLRAVQRLANDDDDDAFASMKKSSGGTTTDSGGATTSAASTSALAKKLRLQSGLKSTPTIAKKKSSGSASDNSDGTASSSASTSGSNPTNFSYSNRSTSAGDNTGGTEATDDATNDEPSDN